MISSLTSRYLFAQGDLKSLEKFSAQWKGRDNTLLMDQFDPADNRYRSLV